MGRTISGTYTTQVRLTNTANNPVSVTGKITVNGSDALYASGGTNWTIINSGAVSGTGGASGIVFGFHPGSGNGSYVNASSVTNLTGGTISGRSGNYGGAGVNVFNYSGQAATIVNSSGATITGADGIYLYNGGTITNSGVISAVRTYGIRASGATIINNVAGIIAGGTFAGAGYGVLLSGGTITNAGTISSASGQAVKISGSGSRLIVDPGAVFVGSVAGVTTTLELASTTSAGTLTATNFSGFTTIAFDNGSQWDLIGGTANLGGTITGFTLNETIDLTGFAATSKSFSSNALVLTNSASATTTLHVQGATFTSSNFATAGDGSGGTNITFLCFSRGTRIATPDGEVPVEALAVGDTVLSLGGRLETVRWIGTGRTLVTPGRRSAATPVIVRKGALADNVPCRDLRVTKGHALFIDDVLIPVEFLVNHRSIVWDDHAREVDIFHIELAQHGVLIADGAPAESYRDDGNRWLFQNANQRWDCSPQEPCAPVLTGGPIVDAIWLRLLRRAGQRPGIPLTDDPELHLLVDGERIDARLRHGGRHVFRLTGRPSCVQIVSRCAVPEELGIARDPRVLGVALSQIVLWQGRRLQMIEAADPLLDAGFHPFESASGLRWTDGCGNIPGELLSDIDGTCDLTLDVACATQYPLLNDFAA